MFLCLRSAIWLKMYFVMQFLFIFYESSNDTPAPLTVVTYYAYAFVSSKNSASQSKCYDDVYFRNRPN